MYLQFWPFQAWKKTFRRFLDLSLLFLIIKNLSFCPFFFSQIFYFHFIFRDLSQWSFFFRGKTFFISALNFFWLFCHLKVAYLFSSLLFFSFSFFSLFLSLGFDHALTFLVRIYQKKRKNVLSKFAEVQYEWKPHLESCYMYVTVKTNL